MTIDEWSIVSAEVDRIEILLRIENSQPGVIGKRSNNPELRTETCSDRRRRSTVCQNNFSSNSSLPSKNGNPFLTLVMCSEDNFNVSTHSTPETEINFSPIGSMIQE